MDYDRQVARIREQNKPILAAFQQWLEAAGLSAKTVKTHVDNVDFFTEYLTYYEPLKRLAAVDADDFYSFSADWFPRKAMWASAASARSNLASFRKFARFMRQTERWLVKRELDILDTLKTNRDEMIEIAETYYDQLPDDW
ncbi:MAG: site-specific integrase [Anaerolineae bacterium]|nr:site-specific integrase [Anaerolineae bacterium]